MLSKTRTCAIFAGCFFFSVSSYAATETVLYSFTGGPDGASPMGDLITDQAGNFYSTAMSGGDSVCNCGTVFKVSRHGKETTLYRFTGEDGAQPVAGLAMDGSGNLYGTTSFGGEGSGYGTVFRLASNGKETVLHSFAFDKGGAEPIGGVILGTDGNFYGTTSAAGDDEGGGTVFRVTSKGKEETLYTFRGNEQFDGYAPLARVLQDGSGNLWGTTFNGGNVGTGAIFELSPRGKETAVYGLPHAANPSAGLISDGAGNFYGTARTGDIGYGGVFKMAPDGTETVLYTFMGGDQGSRPYGDLVLDSKGNLYGTTYEGGSTNNGVIFEITRTGKYEVLYSFLGGSDGAQPVAGLLFRRGTLYGTTKNGGAYGVGTVFKLKK